MTVSKSILRSLAGVTIAGSLAASVLAGTITISDTTNGTTATCTYNSVGVDASGNATTSVSGCTGTVGGSTSGTSTSGTSTSGTSTSGTSTSGTSTSGTTTGGTGADTGTFGSGTVVAGANWWIVDQSGTPNGSGSNTAAPGCVNGASATFGCQTSLSGTTSTGVKYSMNLATIGNTISIRYVADATVTSGYFSIGSGTGNSSVPIGITYSLSETPGDFTLAAPCQKTVAKGAYAALSIGGSACPVTAGKLYYLNIKTTTTCTDCRLWITEPASMTN